jgi:hypothetical protein
MQRRLVGITEFKKATKVVMQQCCESVIHGAGWSSLTKMRAIYRLTEKMFTNRIACKAPL